MTPPLSPGNAQTRKLDDGGFTTRRANPGQHLPAPSPKPHAHSDDEYEHAKDHRCEPPDVVPETPGRVPIWYEVGDPRLRRAVQAPPEAA